MAKVTYDKEITALLVIDPYNDFISEGGKVWDRIKGVAEANDLCSSYVARVSKESPHYRGRAIHTTLTQQNKHQERRNVCPPRI